MELRPIEKWMEQNLGVTRLPLKGGSQVTYYHDALTMVGSGLGHFSVHIIHGKARDHRHIRRRDFRHFLHKRLMEIIAILEDQGR